jgi:hypothetical protein
MSKLIAALLLMTFSLGARAHEGHDPRQDHGHLEFQGGAYHAHLSWAKGPDLSGESILLIEFKDGKTHDPIAGPRLDSVFATMQPEMDMTALGDIAPATDDKGDAILGTYNASGLYLTMGGLWHVQVSVTNADGSQETQTWDAQVGDHDHQ